MKPLKCIVTSLLLMTSLSISAEPVPNVFVNGAVADANEINANFAALVAAVEALQARVNELEGTAGSSLADVLQVTTDNNGYPAVILTGVNLQVRSAAVGEPSVAGVGNIVVGNNVANTNLNVFPYCSKPEFPDSNSCASGGGVWARSHKTGYENLVVGHANSYSSNGGFVAGIDNNVTGQYGSVSGGASNSARGNQSSVSGGSRNYAIGENSSVSAGRGNVARGSNSSVSGGNANNADGDQSSVSGGLVNTASGLQSSVNGGWSNKAIGRFSSVNGGAFSFAIGDKSSISGGTTNRAEAEYSVVGGGASVTESVANGWSAGVLVGADPDPDPDPGTGILPNGNTGVGENVLFKVTTGNDNVAVGKNALFDTTSGFDNVAIGADTLIKQKTGSGNIAIGNKAGILLESGSNNIYIGNPGDVFDSNMIVIGCVGGTYGNQDDTSQIQDCDKHIKTKVETEYLEARGNVSAETITIRGGADIAEPFFIDGSANIEAGMLVSINADRAGNLKLSTTAYDRSVAGIISGAGGVNTGLTLTQDGSNADGNRLVALTGRVYAWVDADKGGAVLPGDLLTTSSTAGHAMKATDPDRARGAILGKAMTGLKSGRGLVLVLVAAQ